MADFLLKSANEECPTKVPLLSNFSIGQMAIYITDSNEPESDDELNITATWNRQIMKMNQASELAPLFVKHILKQAPQRTSCKHTLLSGKPIESIQSRSTSFFDKRPQQIYAEFF